MATGGAIDEDSDRRHSRRGRFPVIPVLLRGARDPDAPTATPDFRRARGAPE
ncbi:protein of unassigned function [Methylobacterium oryzae CBMB20]|jgi:hypothetical protein|uniref:Protein of unassigned function n=1 Tax=Methylobacterium oryzae CBMB20 TaxID=693986 RepID=A0A089NRN2_9HYPH|nr:protein of unassigned function [Methylobacterium oryzae CBMB20]